MLRFQRVNQPYMSKNIRWNSFQELLFTVCLWRACGGQKVNCFHLPLATGVLRLLIHIAESGFLCRFKALTGHQACFSLSESSSQPLFLILALYSHHRQCIGRIDYFHKSMYCMLGILSPITLYSSLSSCFFFPVVHCFLRKFHFYINVLCTYMTLYIYIMSRNVKNPCLSEASLSFLTWLYPGTSIHFSSIDIASLLFLEWKESIHI